jgi:hypothetical protein
VLRPRRPCARVEQVCLFANLFEASKKEMTIPWCAYPSCERKQATPPPTHASRRQEA